MGGSLFRDLKSTNARMLVGARAARSLGQGILAVDFALYLKALHWSAPLIGLLFMGGLLLSALVSLFIGPWSDRAGRRRFLLGYELIQIVAAGVGFASSAPLAIVVATLLGGFGHGLNGGAGPFAPIELAWLSDAVSKRRRPRVYSVNMAVGFVGMGCGALLAALPDYLRPWLSVAGSFRFLFLFVLAGSVLCLVFLANTRDRRVARLPETPTVAGGALTHQENRFLLRLVGINVLNGAGIGLIGPLMAYWFSARFGLRPHQIAPVMAVGLFLTAGSSLLLTRLARRLGVVRAVVGMRLAGAVLLLALPFSPTFPVAAIIYIIRSALNRGTAGARQAINIGLVRSHRRGLAASLNSASLQIPRALGPLFSGTLFAAGALTLPFVLGAILQLAYVYFYQRLFRGYGQPPTAGEPL